MLSTHQFYLNHSEPWRLSTRILDNISRLLTNHIIMEPIVWESDEKNNVDDVDYVSLTAKTYGGALHLMRTSFFIHESVSVAVDLCKHPEAIEELDGLTRRSAEDGVSIVAIDRTTREVVGVSLNKIHVLGKDESSFYREYAASCKHPSSKALLEWMIDPDTYQTIYNRYKANCLLEIIYMTTKPSHRGKGIGKRLFVNSIELTRQLSKGKMVKVSLDDEPVVLEPLPTVVYGVTTSFITQNIMRGLGFETLSETSFEACTFKGDTFASKIDHTKSYIVQCMKL